MADETMQNLKINITDNANEASDSLESLAQSLTSLKQAASGKNSLEKFSSQIEKISEALNGIDSGKAEAFGKIADAVGKLKGAGTFSSTIANNIKALGEALNSMQNSEGGMNALSRLSVAAQDLKEVSISSTIAKRLGDIHLRLSEITDEEVSRLERLKDALSGMQGAKLPYIRHGGSSDGAGDAQDMGDSDLAPGVDKASRSFIRFGGLLDRIRAMSISNSYVIRRLTESIRGLGAATLKASGHGIKSLVKNLALLPVTLGSRFAAKIKQVTSGLGQMFSALKRIAIYRLFRTIIKQITEGFSEGIKNIYAYSRIAGTQFAPSMDRIASATLYLKNSLGSLVAPIINKLAPAIDTVIEKVVDLINVFSMLFAKISGADTYSRARHFSTEWEDAADDASGSVRDAMNEIKRYTLGFDELNILGKVDDDSGGGGGGGGGGTNPEDMFEEVEIDSDISDFVERLKAVFENQDWEALGTEIGELINSAIDAIGWEDIGSTIGEVINGAVQTAFYTLETIDFGDLGESIASCLNNMLEKIDFEFVGRLITEPFTNIGDLIIGFVEKLDWHKVGESVKDTIVGAFTNITEWFEEKDWDKFGEELYDAIKGFIEGAEPLEIARSFLTMLGTALSSVIKLGGSFFDSFLEDLDEFLSNEIKGDTFEETATNIVEKLGEAMTSIGEAFWPSFLDGLFGKDEDIGDDDGWRDKALDIDRKLTSWAGRFANSVENFFKDVWQDGEISIGENIGIDFFPSFLKGIEQGSDDNKSSASFKTIAKNIRDGVSSAWAKLKNKTVTFFANVKKEAKTWWSNVKTWWGEKTLKVKEFTTNVKKEAKTWWSNVKTWWSEKVGKVAEFTTNVKKDVKTWWENVKTWWSEKVGSVERFTTNVVNEAKTWWSNVKTWWNDFTDEKAVTFVANVKKMASTWWSNVKDWWNDFTVEKAVSFAANVVKAAGTWWTDVRTAWNNFTGKTVRFSVGIIDAAKDWWKDVKAAWAKAVGTLWTTLSIKLPKVKVTWTLDPILKKVKIPSFSLEWNAKGGILNGAQIFGMLGNTFLGGGEAGKEAVLPLDRNTGWMDQIAERVLDTLVRAEAMIPDMAYVDNSRNNSEELKNIDNSIEQQNALLRRQNELLAAILQKDTSVQVTANAMASAFSRKNQRDGKTIIPLGT